MQSSHCIVLVESDDEFPVRPNNGLRLKEFGLPLYLYFERFRIDRQAVQRRPSQSGGECGRGFQVEPGFRMGNDRPLIVDDERKASGRRVDAADDCVDTVEIHIRRDDCLDLSAVQNGTFEGQHQLLGYFVCVRHRHEQFAGSNRLGVPGPLGRIIVRREADVVGENGGMLVCQTRVSQHEATRSLKLLQRAHGLCKVFRRKRFDGHRT